MASSMAIFLPTALQKSKNPCGLLVFIQRVILPPYLPACLLLQTLLDLGLCYPPQHYSHTLETVAWAIPIMYSQTRSPWSICQHHEILQLGLSTCCVNWCTEQKHNNFSRISKQDLSYVLFPCPTPRHSLCSLRPAGAAGAPQDLTKDHL